MNQGFYNAIEQTIAEIKQSGMFKNERIIASPQDAEITLDNGHKVLNFCANNYLGLSNHPVIVEAALKNIKDYGYGMSSVRFICGTQTIHRQLENELSDFLGMDDTILFPSCFDANGGIFETLLSESDAIISDQLNHASIIDGVRLCKAKRFRYQNNNMDDLRAQLVAADAAGARFKMIATDGVFSMDGIIANLQAICDLADEFNAIVMVDDSHATGFVGEKGKGTHEFCNVMGRVDILTGTLGKGLGGASGGYISGKKSVVTLLKQRARPYLFSNSVAPMIAATSIQALKLVRESDQLRANLNRNKKLFRDGMEQAGFTLVPGEHPIIPVMLFEEKVAAEFAERLLKHGIYVVAFSYPVVPKGSARIRTQISAAHTPEHIKRAVEAFIRVGRDEMGLIK
jgi:glycine C-acetyltransferase